VQCKASVLVLVAWQKGPLIHLGQESQLVYMVAGDGMAALVGIGATDHGLAVVADAEEHTTPGMIEDMEVPVGRARSPSRSRWIRPCRREPRVGGAWGLGFSSLLWGSPLRISIPLRSGGCHDPQRNLGKTGTNRRTDLLPAIPRFDALELLSPLQNGGATPRRHYQPTIPKASASAPLAPLPSQRPIASSLQPRQRLDRSPLRRLQRPFEVAGPAG
jgi:hypothetical protein